MIVLDLKESLLRSPPYAPIEVELPDGRVVPISSVETTSVINEATGEYLILIRVED